MSFRYKILLIIINCLFLQLLNAQDFQKVDSLELSLEFAEDPKDKVDVLLKLSYEFNNIDPNKALNYSQEAYDISEEIDYEKGILNSMINRARTYIRITDYKMAMEFAVKTKELAAELSTVKELALSLHLIGIIYIELDEYDKSAECLFECLKLSEQINDKEVIGRTFSSIGSVYFKQKNYDKALEYYFKSLNIAKEIKDRVGIARGFNNIAAVYTKRKDNKKARQYFEKALEINKELGNRKSEGINYLNLGNITQKQKNYDEALKYFQQALSIFINLKHTLYITRCHLSQADYFLEINDIERSLEYATKAFEEGKKHGYKTVVYNSAELLSKIYLVKRDTLNAFKHDIIKYQVKDSLNLDESMKELSRLELQYEFSKKEQEKKIEQQRKDLVTLIIIISLIFVLIVIVLIFARQRIKAKIVRLKKQALETELEFKNKELTINVMSLIKKNELLSDISSELIKVKNEAVKDHTKEAIKKIARRLKKSTEDETWKEFKLRFKQVHGKFYDNLTKKFPDLSPGEHRLCAFLRLNMSSKEISELTGLSVTSVDAARYRIRKKLGISNSQINLVTFLSKI